MLARREHGGPEIRAAARRVRRRDLGHTQGYREREDAHDDPSYRNHAGATGGEPELDCGVVSREPLRSDERIQRVVTPVITLWELLVQSAQVGNMGF